jgi:ribokinase
MKIAVVGSTNIDMVTYANKLPEAGETVKGENFLLGFGGKGANQAVMAARFGAQVYMVNSIGEDVFGDTTLENFATENVNTQFVSRVAGPSGVAPIWVDAAGANRIIVVPGANGKMTVEQAETAIAQISDLKIVIGQFEIPQEVTTAAFKTARNKGAITIFNPAPFEQIQPALLENCDWIIPNESEFAGLHPTGKLPTTDAEIIELAKILNSNLCVTLGEAGVALVSNDQVLRIAAPKVAAVDTTGAGDAFVGSFAYGLMQGLKPQLAAELGVNCASLSVTRLGAQASYPTKLEAAEIFSTVSAGN